MISGQGCSAGRHRAGKTSPMQREDIEVAFDHQRLAIVTHGIPRLIKAIKGLPLVINSGFRGIDILGQAVIQNATTEGNHPPLQIMNREEQAIAEQIIISAALLAGPHQASLLRVLTGEAFPGQMLCQRFPTTRCEANLKSPYGFTFIAALAQIAPTGGALFISQQELLIEFTGNLVDAQDPFTLIAATHFFGGNGFFLDFDTDLFTESAYCIGKAQPLHAHQERENVATDTATETVKDLPGRIDIERGALFLVERTETLVIDTGALERQITGNDLNDIGPLANLINFFVCNTSHQCRNSTIVTLSPPCSAAAA